MWGFSVSSSGVVSHGAVGGVAAEYSARDYQAATPMKLLRFLLASAFLTTVGATTAADSPEFPPLFGQIPPVSHWIKYLNIGERNYTYPVVYISSKRFKTSWPEFLIVLDPARYDIVAKVTQSRLARTDCSMGMPMPPPPHTVEISERDDSRTQQCVIPQAAACEYFSAVTKLAGMNWTPAELRPIHQFVVSVDCNRN